MLNYFQEKKRKRLLASRVFGRFFTCLHEIGRDRNGHGCAVVTKTLEYSHFFAILKKGFDWRGFHGIYEFSICWETNGDNALLNQDRRGVSSDEQPKSATDRRQTYFRAQWEIARLISIGVEYVNGAATPLGQHGQIAFVKHRNCYDYRIPYVVKWLISSDL
jgi:hypothetical protein